jgi:anti-sigma regulatory factor (Ser/Thr protein kinase)
MTRSAEPSSLGAFRDFIDAACRARPGVSPQTRYDLKLAVDEACTIILSHGYAGVDPGSIILELAFEPGRIQVTVTDFGLPFEVYEPASPDWQAQPDEGGADVFGLFFIYQTMDEVRYQPAEDGNHLTFVKLLGE